MYEVKMPRLGVTMQAGTVSSWLFAEGDYVEKGEYLFEMETEKSTVEIEAMASGVLRKILVPEGEEIPVNTVIAILAEEKEEIDLSNYLKSNSSGKKESAVAVEETVKEEPQPKPLERVIAAPSARRLAKKLGIQLETITGTGKDGLITEKDVKNAAANGLVSALTVKETIPLNRIQKTMSENMAKSWDMIPHFTQMVTVNMSQVVRQKKELGNVSYNDIIVKTIAQVVREHPIVNSRLNGDEVQVFEQINISIAMNSEQGLVVPVVKDADKKSIFEISETIKALSEKANTHKLTLEDSSDGTITISNLGSLGIETGTPIINHPQSTIIFIGSIEKTPIVNELEEIVIAPMMKLSIAFDHRFIDGVTAAKFTSGVKKALENMTMEG